MKPIAFNYQRYEAALAEIESLKEQLETEKRKRIKIQFDCEELTISELCSRLERTQSALAASQARARAAVECLERAMYTATTNHYDVDLCCMYCKYGPEGTCEGESTVLVGNPADGQEYDWDCRRCNSVSANERGGWEFDYDRRRGPQAGEGERDG